MCFVLTMAICLLLPALYIWARWCVLAAGYAGCGPALSCVSHFFDGSTLCIMAAAGVRGGVPVCLST